ncbi:MAG: metalloregulator ArsR/SmtB family transcription factor [Polyangiaceae bacterium]|nr:metalloregulator ArsR/SmtB family transcription factor [Myxococcales bacterium]MCB9587407.1 metalloregulator ArsR/SmtB family transcription factor [Polyangiaceae bacterium]MCB9605796.1 metalloregulator ArsR/SmtB family transcription factor [Polyangiaceae bacterium]
MISLDATVSLLSLFSDATRIRLMALLGREELSVAELTRITDLPQSRVSTHLGKLRDAGLLRDRRHGASTLYAVAEGIPEHASRLWKSLSAELDDGVIAADLQRCQELVDARESAGDWPDSIAGQMERYYSPGRTWEATARGLVGLLRLGDVLDIGAGDGVISELLSSTARSITLLDRSERMVDAARKRLAHISSVNVCLGDMHELPFADATFDQVLLYNSLTYSHAPERALAEAARVLRPGGALAVVTLNEHSHMQITAAYSHLNAGFSPDSLQRMLGDCALEVRFCQVSSREKKVPYFEVVSAFADKTS